MGSRSHRHTDVQVTLVDRHNHHVFTPFLYQVATALFEPSGAAHPIRTLIRGLWNVEFCLAEVSGINLTLHRVESDRGPISYDYLIVAGGAVNDYFGYPDIATTSFALNDLGTAQALRNHVLACFEAATSAPDKADRTRQLTFAVVGGGPTGVEFSTALSVLVTEMVARDFPAIAAEEPNVILIEGSTTLLASFAPDLREKAVHALRARGVRVESGALVVEGDETGLSLGDGRRIETATAVWAAGVRANPLAQCFPATGSKGRVIVGPTLQVDRHPEVFVVGDLAEIPGRGAPLPMLAQVATQSGRHAARSVLALADGRAATPFRYHDLGTMAVLGRGDAVAEIGPLHLSGRIGWVAWLGLHIARIYSLQVKATVVLSWISGFIFADRPIRLITGPTPPGTAKSAPHQRDYGPSAVPLPAGARPVAPVSPSFARADLSSVNVANANRFGRVAALAWWGQDYPGRRAEPREIPMLERMRTRAIRLRHVLTGDRSKTTDNEQS
jgi:NADH dehydrogenase